MPLSDDAMISSLLNDLRQDTEQSRPAWLLLREILRFEPERIAVQLCIWLKEGLAAGRTMPLAASIISALMTCTKHQPNLIPEEILRSLLSRAEQLDNLSLLCLGTMLARVHPERIITEGIFQVLVATEDALSESKDESYRKVKQFAKKVAFELWGTVAARDPESLVALLEIWAAKAGWQRQPSHLFGELLLKAVQHHPNILGDTIAVLEAIQAKGQQSPGELEPPDRILNELRKLGEALRRKTIAARLAKEVLNVVPPPTKVRPPAGVRDQPVVSSDPRVDRLIEEYLELPDWEERMEEAEHRVTEAMRSGSKVGAEDLFLVGSKPPGQRLMAELTEPYQALVKGVSELVDELIAADRTDEHMGRLVVILCFGLDRRPDLVPMDTFQRWVANEAVFDDQSRAWLYKCLAKVCPDWIVEHTLTDAVSVSIAVNAPGFFSAIGVYYPEFIRGFVERYLLEVGWNEDTAPELMRAMEEGARQHPEEAEAMIAVIERLRRDPPEPGMIDFQYSELSKTLDILRSVRKEGKP
jgi:hypothetical protein